MRIVYQINDIAKSAYVLEQGRLKFTLYDGEEYFVEGKKIIFGAPEIILGWAYEKEVSRFATVAVSSDGVCRGISSENLAKYIRHYSIGFNITRGIAMALEQANKLLQKKLQKLPERERVSREYAKAYTRIVNEISESYEQLRFPVLLELHRELSSSLTYKYGISYLSEVIPPRFDMTHEHFSSMGRTLKTDEVLCEAGDQTRELFVLNRGSLGIYIPGVVQPIATINEPGEIVGEMALLLGNPRNATIRANCTTELTVINERDLKLVLDKEPDFFLRLAVMLSERISRSVSELQNLHDQLAWLEGHPDEGMTEKPEVLRVDSHHESFSRLEQVVFKAYRDHDLPVLQQLYKHVQSVKKRFENPG